MMLFVGRNCVGLAKAKKMKRPKKDGQKACLGNPSFKVKSVFDSLVSIEKISLLNNQNPHPWSREVNSDAIIDLKGSIILNYGIFLANENNNNWIKAYRPYFSRTVFSLQK